MRSDSAAIFIISVIITAGIVGSVYYLNEYHQTVGKESGQSNPAATGENAWTTLKPRSIGTGNQQDAGNVSGQASAPSRPQRTDTPIKCSDPDVGEYWTNAVSCDQADLSNRISTAEPLQTIPSKDRYSGEGYQPPDRAAANSRTNQRTTRKAEPKPNLRLAGKSPPSGLPAECRFPVGKALEIERPLAAADNPYKSKWRESYCQWRCEVIEDQCPVADSYFYFRFREICRIERRNGCS